MAVFLKLREDTSLHTLSCSIKGHCLCPCPLRIMSSISPEVFAAASYDYVIAGGGTAGLTLAARLSEIPTVSVAVIEAGEDRSGDLSVNAWGLTASMLGDPKYDWAFETTPQVCYGASIFFGRLSPLLPPLRIC